MSIANVNGPVPGPKSKQLIEEWHTYEADVTGFQAPVVWDSAKGCVVTDVDANTYIDWTSGVLVTNVGHCHPRLVEAAREATGKLLNNYECPNAYRVKAARRLVEALPEHLDKCFFLSTGSEATEAASRLMKRHSGNFEIISDHVDSSTVGAVLVFPLDHSDDVQAMLGREAISRACFARSSASPATVTITPPKYLVDVDYITVLDIIFITGLCVDWHLKNQWHYQ